MLRTITGLFDSRAEADAVVEHLVRHDGVDPSSVRVHGADASASATTTDDKGFWASLKDLFVPDEDRYAYSEGIRRGGVVVSAQVEEARIEHAMDVFEQHGAVDLDAREAEWRGSGWTGYDAAASTPVAAGTVAGATAAMAPTDVPAVSAAADLSTTGATPVAAVPVAPVAPATLGTGTATGTNALNTGREEVIPIVEEQLRVGKRMTEGGRVRVRSYVTEVPVSEQVQLREEHVTLERRPVDRPLTDADAAFRDRTIEAVEHAEEAVVAKEARVVEEVVVRKDATERTETVSDTVRRQEVEVDDGRVEGTATHATPTTTTTVTPKV